MSDSSLKMFIIPFQQQNVDGAKLDKISPASYSALFDPVAKQYEIDFGFKLGEERYHTILWEKLKKVIAGAEHGIEKDRLQSEMLDLALEKMTRAHDIFNTLDVDDSGGLTVEELAPALTKLGISHHNVSKIMQQADANGDSVLDMSEFILWYNAAAELSKESADGVPDKRARRMTVSKHRPGTAPTKARRLAMRAQRLKRPKTKNYRRVTVSKNRRAPKTTAPKTTASKIPRRRGRKKSMYSWTD